VTGAPHAGNLGSARIALASQVRRGIDDGWKGLCSRQPLARPPDRPVLYGSARLFWNLDWRPGRGVTFSFLEPEWPPAAPRGHFGKVAGYAVGFMALVTGSLTYVFLIRGH
jgi:hypothetical protein